MKNLPSVLFLVKRTPTSSNSIYPNVYAWPPIQYFKTSSKLTRKLDLTQGRNLEVMVDYVFKNHAGAISTSRHIWESECKRTNQSSRYNSFFFNSPPNKEVSKFKVKLRASRKIQANRVYEFRSKTRFGDKKLKKEWSSRGQRKKKVAIKGQMKKFGLRYDGIRTCSSQNTGHMVATTS